MNNLEPKYQVIAFSDSPTKIQQSSSVAENVSHRDAWQIARQVMDENEHIYAVSVRAMGGKDE
ncbi:MULTISPECIES: hypothetical protein [Actinobacillus]|uniref:hypothetical protein n=1 Tax=Actinobacillus TaxID=713 RepID=UPI002441DECE|nr:hypothetical protein [Actinobacillus genomosp. 2]WGE32484.1 hypothetical protein NYR60_02400 [Actinobacillus genomosp. 2]